jgi:hypothetical protein
MTQVREVYIDDNWLTTLQPAWTSLSRLTSARMAGNPFRCDCSTGWMKDWLLTNQVIKKKSVHFAITYLPPFLTR